MDTMGHVYYALGFYDQSAKLLEKAVAIRRRDSGTEQPRLRRKRLQPLVGPLGPRRFAGSRASRAGITPRARGAAAGPNSIETGRSVNMVAVVLQEPQRNDEAERGYKRGAEIFRQAPGDNQVELSGIENDLATLYQERPIIRRRCSCTRTRCGYAGARLGDATRRPCRWSSTWPGRCSSPAATRKRSALSRRARETEEGVRRSASARRDNARQPRLVRHELDNELEGEALFREALEIQRKPSATATWAWRYHVRTCEDASGSGEAQGGGSAVPASCRRREECRWRQAPRGRDRHEQPG